ncbi:hypothetical protein AB0D09_18335 [Streptomyces sp. NPDC049097]|uniref:hypothetical protein n=1 Tax=Streptomyces sp. NPDC049097 TaxID=3155497 RepID=UPI0034202B1F
MRPPFPFAIALGCALLLSGCAGLSGGLPPYGKPVTQAQLVGMWKGSWRNICHATLMLRSDHSLSATGFPTDDDDAHRLEAIRRVSGTGTWMISPGVDKGDPPTLDLTIGATGDSLDFAAGHGGTLVLAATIGDPDDGVGCRFTRT